MIDLYKNRLSELKKRSFDDLCKLEDYQGEKVAVNGRTYTLAIWKDVIGDNELRVVVQIYRRLFLGIGKMDADGFRMSKGGKITPLTKEELYEFI